MGFAMKHPVQVFEKKSTITGCPLLIIASKWSLDSSSVARVRRTKNQIPIIISSTINGAMYKPPERRVPETPRAEGVSLAQSTDKTLNGYPFKAFKGRARVAGTSAQGALQIQTEEPPAAGVVSR
jgi:hypothetical protein